MRQIDRRGLVAMLAASAAALPLAARAAVPKGFVPAWKGVADGWRADLKAEGVVGGGVWVSRGGEVLARETYGLADLADQRAADERTIWHWASITKVFTGVAIMQLRDRGLLSLDDPAVNYLPELRAIHDPFGPIDKITIQHLMSHSSGLRSPTFPWGGDKDWHQHEPADWATLAAMWPYSEIEFAPGSRFSYSNPGVSCLGRIIEIVTREPYEAWIDKAILRPLGMRQAYFDGNPPFLAPYRSNNYYLRKDGTQKTYGLTVDTGVTVANGGLNAPIGDMMKFADFLLGVGDRSRHDIVLSRASLAEMTTPLLMVDDTAPNPTWIGLNFFVVDHQSGAGTTRYFGHAGHQLGYHSTLQVSPETGVAFIAVANTNRQGGNSWPVHLRDGIYDRVAPVLGRVRS